MSRIDLTQVSLLDLFRLEAETQVRILTSGLLALERDGTLRDQLEACMRAAHSLKGAARIVNLTVGVRVAHAMEDCFVAAQDGRIRLQHDHIDLLLATTDLLTRISQTPEAEFGQWEGELQGEVGSCLAALAGLPNRLEAPPASLGGGATPRLEIEDAVAWRSRAPDRVLRVTAENLNRLLSLAGESLVESRWAKPFSSSLLRLQRMHQQLARTLEQALERSPVRPENDQVSTALAEAQRQVAECETLLSRRLIELDLFERRSTDLAHRMYDEALACRMRPFSDAVEGLPRMARDVARALGREVKVEVVGRSTQVDRDILAQLEAPLGHLLRNAIDHGIELPEARRAAGKPREGTVRIEARHSAGVLHITVSDDGCGVDLERVREAIVARNLTTAAASAALSESELLQFLFLPGFSMKGTVTDVSGRGVGLDAVQEMVKQVHGTVRVSSQPGAGMQFRLQLPVTLSVVRTLLTEIAGESYAFPLASIVRALKLPKEKIAVLEGRAYFDLDGRQIGLVAARQVLAADPSPPLGDDLAVVVMGDDQATYGLIVDRFVGEHELVVHPLDPQLGRIKDIAAAALMEDGAPVLIVDIEDMIRSLDKLVTGGRLGLVAFESEALPRKKRKRVLVVDDSLTARELERKLIGNRGYEVEVAVDGVDGWNAVRTGHFDLVITDIDMPRMNGIELVTRINADVALRTVPVMVVSYKDRDEDRRRGLEAGAAYYLTKGSFHDETLLQSVIDLIGEPDA